MAKAPQFTQEEIDKERNRRKCLKYQQTHREAYRKYQREYSAANRYELKNLRYRLAQRIKKNEAILDDLRVQLEAMDNELVKRAQGDEIEIPLANNPFGIKPDQN